MKKFLRYSVLGLLSSVFWFSAGCKLLPEQQADPVRQFTLSGPAATVAVADAVSVRPLQLAGHLRSRAMAVRVSENEVIYLDDIRWAESLEEAITQVLRNRLRQVGGGAFVTVQVQRCELVRSAGNAVQLAATYTITAPGSPARNASFSASSRVWDGKDHGDLVALLRDAVNELGDAIATSIEAR